MILSPRSDRSWVVNIMGIITQVVFVFSFLTLFFFLYVTKVEKEEFRKQVNIIVDNLISKIIEYLPEIVDKIDIDKDTAIFMINGMIAVAEEKMILDTEKSVKKIMENNKKIQTQAYTILAVCAVTLVVIYAILLLSGYRFPFQDNIKGSLIIVLFVGLTELAFLTLIASRYISADPNAIKREIGNSIMKWIIQHKKQRNTQVI